MERNFLVMEFLELQGGLACIYLELKMRHHFKRNVREYRKAIVSMLTSALIGFFSILAQSWMELEQTSIATFLSISLILVMCQAVLPK